MKINQDKNFDTLINRLDRNIYQTAKGDWRLKLLHEDLQAYFQAQTPLAIWDTGCGLAQLSLELAKAGHRLTLCDLSEKMLMRAKEQFQLFGLDAEFHQQSAQTLASELPQFDLVVCHALLEWLAEPLPSLKTIAERVKPGGSLSLLFYNRNAMIYTNTLRGGWRWQDLLNDRFIGRGNKLTPPHPQYPHEIIDSLTQWRFTISAYTGIRVFHDYLSRDVLENGDISKLFELEHRFCRMPTYRDMGRYVHVLAKK